MAAAAVALSDLDSNSNSRKYLWNPCEVLEIEPLEYGFTCIGKEVTKGGSKCTSPLEKKACNLAEDLLNEIRRTNMAEKTLPAHQLQRLAGLLLCHGRHQYQAAEKARDWMVKIREHSQGLKESSAEISSSDIQAMKTELGQIKSQLALIALKYSNLREKHAAVLYENETLRQGQIKLKGEHDSIVHELKEKNEQTKIKLRQRLRGAGESLERTPINLKGQPEAQKFQGEESVSSHQDFDLIKSDISVERKQLALSVALAAFSEKSDHSLRLQDSPEGLSALLDQIPLIFANDPTLQPLFASALKNDGYGVMRFGSDVLQILRDFGTDLRDEVQGADQKNMALIIGICANYLAVAISSQFNGEDSIGSEPNQRGKMHPADSAQLQTLFYFLESHRVRILLGLRDNSDLGLMPEATASATEIDRYQNSGELKQLIVESRAFVTLRQRLEQFVHQKCGVPVSSFTSTISYAMDNDRVVRFTPWTMTIRPGYIDWIKRKLEKWVRSPVIWWPLQPPKLFCPDGYMRISWACACGIDLSVDVPEEVASKYRRKCTSASNNQSILPLHNNTQNFAAPDGTSTQTPNTAPTSGGLFHRSSPQAAALTSDPNSAADTKSSLQPDRYVHWCVDANRYETELNHISIPTLDDSNFISKLKSAYWTTRGIRQWFSLTDCYGVRFVSFERINRNRDLIACGAEDLPCTKTNKDYVYTYRDPRHQFLKTLEQSLIHCFHNAPSHRNNSSSSNRCCTPQNMHDILTRIPKKTNGRLKHEYGALGYGMHAVPGWAVWKLMVALLISQLGPAVFVVKWLAGHGGDLQNAFSLSMYAVAVINLVVVVPDFWSLQK